MRLVGSVVAGVALFFSVACAEPEPAVVADGGSMIIHGGTMYLGNEQTPETGKAILIKDGRITTIASLDDLRTGAPEARLVDATGGTVLPGLVDSHAHIDGLGIARAVVDLVGTTSFDEVLDRLDDRLVAVVEGEWIEGRGWDQNDWNVKEFPSATQADARVGGNPLWLRRIDGHAGLANTVAMKIAGVDSSTLDPDGGRIVRDSSGNPTGVFIDNAMDLVTRHIPAPSRKARKRRLVDALDYIASQGLTGVHEAGSDDPVELIELYRELADEGSLPIRIYYMLPDNEPLLQEWFAKEPLIGYAERLTIRSVKLYADGALGSRGAALLAPYSDDPHNEGIMTISPERITDVAQRAKKAGFQVGTHAIGDRGVRTVIESYEAAGVTPDDRFRVEHFQVSAIEDIDRASSSGIIAAMQPTHATSDMPWAEDRLGSNRVGGAYAWRKVLDSGGRLALGSDFPIEAVNPFYGIYSAVTRQDHDGHPPGGWTPDEKLSLSEAIRGFTLDAAYAGFDEVDRGTIEPGKSADFTIVEGDLTSASEADLWRSKVAMTIVGGEVVYDTK